MQGVVRRFNGLWRFVLYSGSVRAIDQTSANQVLPYHFPPSTLLANFLNFVLRLRGVYPVDKTFIYQFLPNSLTPSILHPLGPGHISPQLRIASY